MTVVTTAKFPKSARLRKRAEFLQLASAQHKSAVRGFLVVWRENDMHMARLGITASKKIGCAVVRNSHAGVDSHRTGNYDVGGRVNRVVGRYRLRGGYRAGAVYRL